MKNIIDKKKNASVFLSPYKICVTTWGPI